MEYKFDSKFYNLKFESYDQLKQCFYNIIDYVINHHPNIVSAADKENFSRQLYKKIRRKKVQKRQDINCSNEIIEQTISLLREIQQTKIMYEKLESGQYLIDLAKNKI